jgi:hypothetical protein
LSTLRARSKRREVPIRDTCALSIFVCALSQDRLSRRAYTTASLSPARSMTMRFNLGYKFAHLSGYEMLRKTEPLHPPNGGCKIKLFRYPILFSDTANCAISHVFPEIAGGWRPRVVRSKAMVLGRLHLRSHVFLSSRRRSVHLPPPTSRDPSCISHRKQAGSISVTRS